MTKAPAAPDDEDMALNELLEHRDLQNAQAGSMASIWDNPADERWNNLPPLSDEANGTEQCKEGDASNTSGKPAS